MAQDAIARLVASLSQATTSKGLADILCQIKNSLVGHVQRKESAVRSGLILPLVQIIAAELHADASVYHSSGASHLNEHEQNQLQATIILASLAAGGRQFISPLIAANADTHLLNDIAHQNASLVTARLQGLRNLAASFIDSTADEPPRALRIVTTDSIAVFNDILRKSHPAHADQQVQLVCELITFAAEQIDVKVLLAESGILDTLAALLVSYSVAMIHPKYQGDAHQLPPVPSMPTIPKILSAIHAIVIGSCYRVYRFIYSSQVKDLCISFNGADEDAHLVFNRNTPDGSFTLLPQIHTPAQKNVSFHPTTNAFAPATNQYDLSEQQLGDAVHVNAVLSWLLVFARKLSGSGRLTALHLVAIVEGSIGEVAAKTSVTLNVQKSREREKQLAFLAVPLASRLVQDALDTGSSSKQPKSEDQTVREQACEVLHELIKHSKDLQVAAVDAGAIKSVCSTLRKSFESVPPNKPLWSPRIMVQNDATAITRLGDAGLPTEVLHTMKRRLGALHALAALADKEESHRKAIVDANVVSCLIEALKPLAVINQATSSRVPRRQIEGNTTDVILAACRATQTMSRSVAILRTSLIDAGIAKPILELLRHPQLEVQIAATDVCANLLLDFSPMRESLIDLGVVQTLCNHAKTGPSALRFSSLWALKHLMLQAEVRLKIDTLDQLGAHWVLRAAAGDQSEKQGGTQGGGVALSSANAAGEQIDILNPASMDVDEPAEAKTATVNEDEVDYADEDGELLYDESSKTHYQASSMRSTLHTQAGSSLQKQLAAIRSAEQNTALQAKRDDAAIQEQALDFLRNFLNGNDCAAMVDHIFSKIRPQELFDVLLEKLSSVPVARLSRVTGSLQRPVLTSLEIILSSLHVLTHISNGNAKHKEMVINHQSLLEVLLPHFSHPNPRVRVMAVWTITSLTWTDDIQDQAAARRRVAELRKAGIEHAIRRLSNDPELDVKERVKVTIRQFEIV